LEGTLLGKHHCTEKLLKKLSKGTGLKVLSFKMLKYY